ncbi:KH domain-containing protein HEN4-like protein [Tanacetum coccineum]
MNEPPKRHHKQPQPPLIIPPNHICFRLLCHSSRIGGIIGKSGHVIKNLQTQTLTKIRVEDPVPLSDDRIITVIGNTQLTKTLSFNTTTGLVVNIGSASGSYNSDDDDVFEVSDAQEALVRVFERVLEVAAEGEGEGGYMVGGGVVSCRILTDKGVIGSVIGKGGKVIEGIRKDCGCKIRVLVKDKLPSCANFNDEMVEIEGDVLATKKALVAVARCLQDCPYAQKTKMVTGRPDHAAPWENIPNGHMDYPSVSSESDTYHLMDSRASQQEITFKMLCSNDWVGRLIGKSGSIIQALQNESGATITIGGPVSDCDERLITITAMETPESRDSPAQNAVILVFNRCVEIGYPTSMGTQITARLLISPNQMGCLLGKGGSIIADMRKVTGAYMKIVGDDQVPKCALETDQVVLVRLLMPSFLLPLKL